MAGELFSMALIFISLRLPSLCGSHFNSECSILNSQFYIFPLPHPPSAEKQPPATLHIINP